jgi:H+/Cl- antiporter ClcA
VTAPAQQSGLGGRTYLTLILLGAAVGIPAAYLSALFLAAIHGLEHLLWNKLPDALGASSPPWYLVVGLPVAGAVVVAAARAWLPGDGGHRPLAGLSRDATPVSYVPGVVLAAIGTLAFGAVLGPEAPVMALGSAVGMLCVRLARVTGPPAAVLSAAGQFSAISALFGGPLVAGVLLVEGGVGMGTALFAALLPGLVSAAVGYVIFEGFGHWSGLNAPGIQVPNLPTYNGRLVDLLIGLVVGVLTALVIVAVRMIAEPVSDRGAATLGMSGLVVLGGLAVGGLAQLADALGADSQDVLFSGQASIGVIVTAGSTSVVLVTLVAKAIAYAICLGCGFRGGPIFPAVFLGVGLAALAVVWFDTSPTLAIAVGAAAGMAAQTQLLITPLLFGSLLVGHAGLDAISASVFATVGAWLTMTALDQRRRGRPAADTVSAQPRSRR